MKSAKKKRLIAPKCNFPLVNGIINELRPSVSPSIIIIVLKIEIAGVKFAFDSFRKEN